MPHQIKLNDHEVDYLIVQYRTKTDCPRCGLLHWCYYSKYVSLVIVSMNGVYNLMKFKSDLIDSTIILVVVVTNIILNFLHMQFLYLFSNHTHHTNNIPLCLSLTSCSLISCWYRDKLEFIMFVLIQEGPILFKNVWKIIYSIKKLN